MTLPDFHLAQDVAAKGVRGAYSLLLGIDQAAVDRQAVEQFVDKAVAQRRQDLQDKPSAEDPVLQGYRALHQAFGVPTRKLYAAPETLARYIERRGDMPRIGPLVDLYNAISLESGLALGAHDLARIDGNIWLRTTDGSEHFQPIGAAGPEAMRAGEYAYVDDANDVICRQEVRQVAKTKVTDATTDVFLIVQGKLATPLHFIADAHARLVAVLTEFLGGKSILLHQP